MSATPAIDDAIEAMRHRTTDDGHVATVERLRDMLAEAGRQIEYLHEKFGATGSGNAVLARLRAALAE